MKARIRQQIENAKKGIKTPRKSRGMKYGSKEDTQKVIEALKAYPDKSYQEIANMLGRATFGVVASIARRNGLQHGRKGPRRFTKRPVSKRYQRMRKEQDVLQYVKDHPELTYAEIADYFGVAEHIIGGLVYRSGFRRSAVTPEIKAKEAEIAEYIKAHPEMSYSDMGRELKLPTLRIANIARKHGLFRGKGQGPRHNSIGRRGVEHTPEVRERLSQHMTELWASIPDVHRKRLSRIMKGTWTDERRAQLSRALKQMWKDANG